MDTTASATRISERASSDRRGPEIERLMTSAMPLTATSESTITLGVPEITAPPR
jgi:hypothetical protein